MWSSHDSGEKSLEVVLPLPLRKEENSNCAGADAPYSPEAMKLRARGKAVQSVLADMTLSDEADAPLVSKRAKDKERVLTSLSAVAGQKVRLGLVAQSPSDTSSHDTADKC